MVNGAVINKVNPKPIAKIKKVRGLGYLKIIRKSISRRTKVRAMGILLPIRSEAGPAIRIPPMLKRPNQAIMLAAEVGETPKSVTTGTR